MIDKKKHIELLQKLKNVTLQNGNSLNEVLAASEKILKIKEEYNITAEDIELGKYSILEDDIELDYKRVPTYIKLLVSNLSIIFDCRVITRNKYDENVKFIFIGLEKDIVICKYFFIYLSRILIKEGKGKKDKNAYLYGIINTIIDRLKEKLNKNKNNEYVNKPESKGIILYKEKAIDLYISEKYKLNKGTKIKVKGDRESYLNGIKKGKDISLNDAVNSSNLSKKYITNDN